LAVDQPRRAESINDLAESQRPEGFRDGNLYRAPFRQRLENAVCLGSLLRPEHHAEALRLLVLPRHGVTAFQDAVARGEPRMKDFVAPPRLGLPARWL